MHNALGVILSTYTYCTAYIYSLKLPPQCLCISLVGYHIASARPAAHVPHNYIHLHAQAVFPYKEGTQYSF